MQSISRQDSRTILATISRETSRPESFEIFSIADAEFATAESLICHTRSTGVFAPFDAFHNYGGALNYGIRRLVDHFVAADAIIRQVAELEGICQS